MYKVYKVKYYYLRFFGGLLYVFIADNISSYINQAIRLVATLF